MKKLLTLVYLTAMISAASIRTHAVSASDYNVIWNSPSKDCSGSMPLGNGDIGVNAWVEPNGDLIFYISKTDSWGDNARLLKIGKVRIKLDPALVQPGSTFRQTLDLPSGTINIQAISGNHHSTVSLWVDANHPAIQVAVNSDKETTATASIELWRTKRYTLPSIECSDVMTDRSKPKNMHAPTIVEPDTILSNQKNRIGWYHHNIKSVGPKQHAETQGMTGYPRKDPLLHRTFGAIITATNPKQLDDTHLQSQKSKTHRFTIHVLTKHPSSPDEWLAEMDKTISNTKKTPFDERRHQHTAWWNNFWNRSWINITTCSQSVARMIPQNNLPIKIGADQDGENRFAGKIENAAIYDRILSDTEIADRAAKHTPQQSSTEKLSKKALSRSVTMEFWIKPESQSGSGGRIIDNCTPGGSNGFILDTYPGNSLRLIVGRTMFGKKNCLKTGVWQHVAATINTSDGTLTLFLDGKPIAHKTTLTANNETFTVARAYALQRFITACAGRGQYPIKFNGSIFTVPYPGKPGDADYRRWGPGYWWQNTRLPYLSLCTTGDFEMMEPLFKMYADTFLPINLYRTKLYFGFEDSAYYIECMMFWGDVFNKTYGWKPMKDRQDPLQESRWHKREWVAGPELVWMMLDAYDYTQNEDLLQKRIIPVATAVMRFFDNYYKTDASGKLVMNPSQALETWWDCTNPMPEIAGLRAITARLLALPENSVPKNDRAYWLKFSAKIPELPTCVREGVRMWAPAEKFARKSNCENPELYCVFPFRLCSFENQNRELGIQALRHRWNRGGAGWSQDELFMAYLGLDDDARKHIVNRAGNHHKGSRFPAFWGPNYDWIPDQDHGGVLTRSLQAMLMQADPYSRKIYLMPAWPKNWDCDFKLHAPYRTIVEGRIKDGKVTDLKVTPSSRRKDIIIATQ